MNNWRMGLAVLIIVSCGVGIAAPDMGDFDVFYRAAEAVLSGANPYTSGPFYSPLYVAWAFIPFTLLALPVAFHIHAGLVFLGYGVAFYLLTREIITTVLLMLSPFPLMTAYYGNLEAWVLLGAVVAPVAGIWLVLAKPQMGLIVAALLIWQAWRGQSWGAAARLLIPVGAVYAISLMLGMLNDAPVNSRWNISTWPIGLAIGVPVAFAALRYRSIKAALFAGPFMSPYLGPMSYTALLPALARYRLLTVAGVIASWALVYYWRTRI